jgi:hypothetical protein
MPAGVAAPTAVWLSVDADAGLEAVAVGMVAPEKVGDLVGFVVLAGSDRAADGGVGDVDAA